MSSPQRDVAIQELFVPLDVRAYVSTVNPALIDELAGEEATAITAMAQARQAEFATARACARMAMADLGVHAAVPRGENGAPQWPDSIRGSISHTRGFCVAVASRGDAAIGLDVEEVARMKPAVERRILVDAERDLVASLSEDDRRVSVATIFAAKEAFYKAHHGVEPRYLGFDAVHVTVDGGDVHFAPWSGDVAAELLAATTGRFRIDQGRVIVGVAITATTAPSALPSPA